MELTNTEIKKNIVSTNEQKDITKYALETTTLQLDSSVVKVELTVNSNESVEDVYENYIKTQLNLFKEGVL